MYFTEPINLKMTAILVTVIYICCWQKLYSFFLHIRDSQHSTAAGALRNQRPKGLSQNQLIIKCKLFILKMQAILAGYLYLRLTEIIYISLHIRDSRENYVYKNNYWCLEQGWPTDGPRGVYSPQCLLVRPAGLYYTRMINLKNIWKVSHS